MFSKREYFIFFKCILGSEINFHYLFAYFFFNFMLLLLLLLLLSCFSRVRLCATP